MESERLLPCSQDPTSDSYSEPDQSFTPKIYKIINFIKNIR
jgi:hypothetical protein